MDSTFTGNNLLNDFYFNNSDIAITNKRRERDYKILTTTIAILCVLSTMLVFATSADNDINRIIDSPMFRGRNVFVDRYLTWLAFIAQMIITTVGFLIIMMKTITFSMSMLYLVAPKFWDRVARKKNDYKSRIEGKSKSDFDGASDWGTWLASILIPNIKAYSDFADDDGAGMTGAGETDIASYIKSNAVTTILFITVASILWSGKMLQLMGSISDGLIVVVDKLKDYNYSGKVSAILEADRDYKFLYDGNTIEGKNKTKLANAVYGQIKGAISDNNTSKFYNGVGANVGALIDHLDKQQNGQLAGSEYTYVTFKNPNLRYSITWNSEMPETARSKTGGNNIAYENGTWLIPFSKLVPQTDGHGETSMLQQTVGKTGIMYITFTGDQLYEVEDTGKTQNNKKK